MLKAVLGVIVGYLAMSILAFALFTGAWVILKAEGSFKPGSWDVSTTWLLMSFVVSIVAALVGGFVCALIATRRSRASMVLAGLVFVLGLLMAVPVMLAEPITEPRPADITMTDAMTKAQQPMFVALLNPFIGAAGVSLGAALRKR